MFGVGWKLPLVSEEFANIDSAGRLVFREPTCHAHDESVSLPGPEHVELINVATPSRASPKSQEEDLCPSTAWSLQKWLLHFQAKDSSCLDESVSAALERLQSRRLDDALSGDDEDLSGHLDNAIHWLGEMAKAVALLQEIRKDHDRILHSPVLVPIGDATSGVLSEWAACKAQDILAKVLPELVDQVISYQEHLATRSCKGRNEEKLNSEVTQLAADLKEEKRRGNYYYKKLRELQQAQSAQKTVGISKINMTTIDKVDDVPIYTEADFEALKNEWEAKLEALEKEWQDLLDEERKNAKALQDSLRAEIDALKDQIEALKRELEALRSREGSGGRTHNDDNAFLTAPGHSPRSSDSPSHRPSHLTIDPNASPRASATRSSPSRSATRDRFDGPDVRATPTAISSVEQEDGPYLVSPRRFTIDAPSTFERCMPSRMLRREEDAHRKMAEELKRKVFEKVLEEERIRQALVDEEDQAALAARFESQGWGELINLIRRVDDVTLRRDIFRLLKLYQKRTNPALEIVCVYCRRKPRPDQIHSYDVPSRPASANKTQGRTAVTANNADSVPAPSTVAAQSLPRVSSSPSVVLGLPTSTKAFGEVPLLIGTQVRQDARNGRPSKLVAVLPSAAPKPSKRPRSAPAPMGLPSRQRSALPPGWVSSDAAC